MSSDLEIIEQLGDEIGVELKEENRIEYSDTYKGAYQTDSNGHVIRLALENLELKEFPEAALKLKYLEYLSFYENQLNALPSEILQLTNLTKLYLSSNQLSTLPPEMKAESAISLSFFLETAPILLPGSPLLKGGASRVVT